MMKIKFLFLSMISILISACIPEKIDQQSLEWLAGSIEKMEKVLIADHGQISKDRIQRGLKQVAEYWKKEDGDVDIFESFVQQNFVSEQSILDQIFDRYQKHIEKINGHMDRLVLDFRWQTDVDLGPILPFDQLFAAYNPAAHLSEDLFRNKIAFVALLNFPLTTLKERTTDGLHWSRRQWAEARLAAYFNRRVPSHINSEISKVSAESDKYISGYNIWMHHLVNDKKERFFPPGMRLLSHWNLRDEIKSQYSQPEQGLLRQRMIQRVMERIIDQTIPLAVIDNPGIDWDPFENEVSVSEIEDYDKNVLVTVDTLGCFEPNTRYLMLQKNYLVQKSADPYWPTMPNYITRRFDLGRELPEERVVSIFDQILSSSELKQVAELIQHRLNRNLEPFDVWYNGFRTQSTYNEADLNAITQKRYPIADAFEKDIPRLLRQIGFSANRSKEISGLITVDPARGSGHAWGAQMRGAKTHLRTRIGATGMDYKGYNIAVHELGHNVEQVISTNNIDYSLLQGVPNNAFTEAIAFVFQSRDLQLLSFESNGNHSDQMRVLNDFWSTCEIAAVALIDIAIWHWMYDHPQATPAELKEAMIFISKDIWNKYFADIFKHRDVTLLAIYSHMISYPLYLADYALGHMIAYQVEEQIQKAESVGEELDRIILLGNISPDLWMLKATGNKIKPNALIHATNEVLQHMHH